MVEDEEGQSSCGGVGSGEQPRSVSSSIYLDRRVTCLEWVRVRHQPYTNDLCHIREATSPLSRFFKRNAHSIGDCIRV
jgi:hypothetical protein